MKVLTTIAEMEAVRDSITGSVGLVPTMGYLHEGHLRLVRQALKDNDHVIVSIFVNPTQFAPNEDLDRYPRDLNHDLKLLESALSPSPAHGRGGRGVRDRCIAFVPSVEEMYPPGFDEWVEVRAPLTERLEGAHRPGHFRGVTTVVARLFRIVQPHRAYFGQKDAQQLRVIRRMVQELSLDVEIVPMPTVREADGLALSSRNVYLSPAEREVALAIPRSLALARRLVMNEGVTHAGTIRQAIRAVVETPVPVRPEEPGVGGLPYGGVSKDRTAQPRSALVLDYVSFSDEQTLEELKTIDRPALVLIAARIGTTRLIDNTIVLPKGIPVPGYLQPLYEADSG